MDKTDLVELEILLGISKPWGITSTSLDEPSNTLNVYLTKTDNDHITNTKTVSGTWLYIPIGTYRCIIHCEVDAPISQTAQPYIDRPTLELPAFLGHPYKNYSNYLRQKIALAKIKETPPYATQELLRIDESTYQEVLSDLNSCDSINKRYLHIPTQIDKVWRLLLQGKINLASKHVALNMLLSKLQMSTRQIPTKENLSKNIFEIHNFFVSNIQQLSKEISQLCGISPDRLSDQPTKEKLKLILPALQNPVWEELLTGKLDLKTRSVPLSLLISRQRIVFMQKNDRNSISTLRDYFQKNYRLLKNELLTINKAMKTTKRRVFSLPKEDHFIWQKIIDDTVLVPSKNTAYRLLLSRLRMQVLANNAPSMRIEAAKTIRNFIRQNHKVLGSELKIIAQHCTK